LLERVDDLIDPAHASGSSRQQQAVSGALLAGTQLKKPETDEEEKTKIKATRLVCRRRWRVEARAGKNSSHGETKQAVSRGGDIHHAATSPG